MSGSKTTLVIPLPKINTRTKQENIKKILFFIMNFDKFSFLKNSIYSPK